MRSVYSMSVAATKNTLSGTEFNHSSAMLVADDDDQAVGMAQRYARERFPVSEGWGNHSVAVAPQNQFIAKIIASKGPNA